MTAWLTVGACGVIAIAYAATTTNLDLRFSAHAPSATLPAAFRVITLPNIKSNQFSLVADQTAIANNTVLRVDSRDSAGSVALPLSIDPKVSPTLAWRWKIDRVIQSADGTTKESDDYAARVYVFFDVPLDSLSFVERTKIRLARMMSGNDVPTAALCYVWDNRAPVGTRHWSPYTTRVHVLTLQSGSQHLNEWIDERHDVAADFRASFGIAAPRITGVALGNDTDQTHESVTTWFGDVSFHAK
jgi:hypothetical protein